MNWSCEPIWKLSDNNTTLASDLRLISVREPDNKNLPVSPARWCTRFPWPMPQLKMVGCGKNFHQFTCCANFGIIHHLVNLTASIVSTRVCEFDGVISHRLTGIILSFVETRSLLGVYILRDGKNGGSFWSHPGLGNPTVFLPSAAFQAILPRHITWGWKHYRTKFPAAISNMQLNPPFVHQRHYHRWRWSPWRPFDIYHPHPSSPRARFLCNFIRCHPNLILP